MSCFPHSLIHTFFSIHCLLYHSSSFWVRLIFTHQMDTINNRRLSPTTKKQLVDRCIESLTHACQCRDVQCEIPSCLKLKEILEHTKGCELKVNGECRMCKQLIALCCHHAKNCEDSCCEVPFCPNIKGFCVVQD